MNEKGFIFTTDAILMILPIIIIIGAISGITFEVPHVAPYYVAQDAMDSLGLIDESEGNLNTMASNITLKNNKSIPKEVKLILNSFNSYKYNLTYYNATNDKFETLDNKSAMSTSLGTISTATRVYGNVTFKLYMWR